MEQKRKSKKAAASDDEDIIEEKTKQKPGLNYTAIGIMLMFAVPVVFAMLLQVFIVMYRITRCGSAMFIHACLYICCILQRTLCNLPILSFFLPLQLYCILGHRLALSSSSTD